MTRYSNGAARERRIIHKLRNEGWWCMRSAGSHGIVDIIAMKNLGTYYGIPVSRFRFIQSKKTGRLSAKEREEAKEFKEKYGYDIEVL